MIETKPGERIDDLLNTGLKIIQSKEVFSFSLDAVLLAHFVYVPILKGGILDLCTGNGVIPLLLSKRTKGDITGVDIQARLCDMAERSVRLNRLDDRIRILCEDVKRLPEVLGHGVFNVVTCNPPYFSSREAHIKNPNPFYAIARHEICLKLDEAVAAASRLVRQKGKVAFIHRPDRLEELLASMRTHRLAPKRLQFVHPRKDGAANMVLVEAIKDGQTGIKVLPPLTVYDEHGAYTKELLSIING